MKATPEQKLAIDIRGCNVLVSAAAGSGKTSVLVERIIRRVTGEDGEGEPVDIDRLLVMTFTNAAAAEMRSRIRDAIEDRISRLRKEGPADTAMISNLEKQSLLVHSAMITTIHGFCKSVLADHFEEVGIDPNFRVADENECALLRQDAVDKCMEAAYERADESFLTAVECFSRAKDDRGLAELIIPIYKFIMADPDPEGFLKRCCKNYEIEDYDAFLASPFAKCIADHIRSEYAHVKQCIEAAEDIIAEYEALRPYKANIDAYMSAVTTADEALDGTFENDYAAIRSAVMSIDAPRFGSIRDDKLTEAEIEAKKVTAQLRDAAKAQCETILKDFPFDLATAFSHLQMAREPLAALAALAGDFIRTYDAIKRDNNVIDFNDMEHMAVSILKNPDIAAIYRGQFEEIYVDEYQDTNMAQEMLVSLICRKNPGNVFQVGDVKQSIYRFRQARPDIFLGKYNTYTDEDGDNRRILLNDNFRSRREVTDAVNEVFYRIMKADLGGIEYDRATKLNCGATCYREDTGDDYRTELIIGIKEELSPEELTANIIAERIDSMIRDGFTVYDKALDRERPVSYRDFTVLVRSIKKYEPVFRKVFGTVGIPVAVTGREGYLAALEVQTALAFLASVDNSLCDIELATLMRSPVGGFDDKDMAMLSAFSKAGSLYERVRAGAGLSDPAGKEEETADGEEAVIPEADTITEITDTLRDKCISFLEMLDRYKVMSTYTTVRDLLSDFIDNEYADYVKCMSGAAQRMANLKMLLVRAEEFGKTSFKGLYQFVRYMDQIRKYSIDDGEAGIAGENDDVVRIMTMHASKGLEFPVCFLAGMEKQRNTQDESGKIIWSTRQGFGLDFTDIDRRICGPTLAKVLVCDDNKRESIAEEMRILYVAMTRAREKLIMVATDKEDGFAAPAKAIENVSSYLDMIKTAYAQGEFEHMDISLMKEADIISSRFEKELEENAAADTIYDIINEYTGEEGGTEQHTSADDTPSYLSRISFKYPYPLNPDHVAKLSVSDLKHRAIEEKRAAGEELVPDGQVLFGETQPDKYIPKFMRQEGQTKTGATFYGTAFHRIMELWDYKANDNSVEYIREFAKKMHDLHRMDRDQAGAVNPGDVKAFLESALARRMAHANANKRLFREQPFVIGVPDGEETVLVQGIIDAYFIEDDGITIVDYKTDHVSDETMLINRYRTQLEYYGKALRQITGMPIKSLSIYSTCLKREIVIT